MTTIPGLLFRESARRPKALAIVDGDIKLSYSELYAQVRLVAGAMKKRGIGKGDRFAIWAPNCAEWIVATLAGQMLGAIMVTLNTRYKGGEAADILRRAKCKMLFTVKGFLGHDYPAMLDGQKLPSLKHIVLLRDEHNPDSFFDFMAEADGPVQKLAARSGDISDIIFTSGTTGAPKGAMTTHGQNVEVFESFTSAIGMNENDRYLVVNPFFHSFGYKAGWLACLIVGCAVYPMPVYEPKAVMAQVEKHRISVMPGAPTVFQMLLDHPERSEHDISSLRVATTGATTIPVDLIRRMHEELGIDDVFSAYGLTESTGVVSLCRKGDDFETIATTCGQPLPGTELKIADDSGNEVERGVQGEIWIRGFNVMQGYLDNPKATAETITPDGWLKTGDIGIQDAAGYIKVTDRKKDMVIVGGFNCYPAEIEKQLLQHPQIKDVAVVGMPDQRLGEVTHAHLVSDGEMTPEDIIAWARENMANYKVPRRVTIHESLPRNASGKILKYQLKNVEKTA